MDELISKRAALLAMVEKGQESKRTAWGESWELSLAEIQDALKDVPAAERWIPVSEWLPELGVEVLTYTENDGLIEIQSRVGTDLWENRHGDLQELRTVTAWMPKPKPYRKEGEL